MGISIDIHKYNVHEIVDWVVKERNRFGLAPLDEVDILDKLKNLISAYTDLDTRTGNFYILYNEYYDGYNAATNFNLDVERLFEIKDREKREDGSWIFASRLPYEFADSNRERLDDSEWEKIFGYIPDIVDGNN